jgi:hypothetical protein
MKSEEMHTQVSQAVRWLDGLTGISLAGAAVCLTLVFLDPREITGAPAWLKPLKFFVSSAIYSFSLRWVIPSMRAQKLGLRMVQVTVWGLFYELVAISAQAARGVRSHFNFSTPFDSFVFISMGTVIMVVWAAGVVIAWQILRNPDISRARRVALTWGMGLFLVGALGGQQMGTPKPDQLAALQAGERVVEIGGHAVGAADGGTGILGVGWSRTGGDLRVAHFFGIHGLQGMLLALLLLTWAQWSESRKVLVLHGAGVTWLSVWVFLFFQAISGRSVYPL